MAALTSQAVTVAGITPSAVAVSSSDTIAQAQFGPVGLLVRVINAGASPDTVTIVDPNLTAIGSAATNPTVSVTNGTTKEFLLPAAAVNQSTGLATLQHSFTTSVTIELKRV